MARQNFGGFGGGANMQQLMRISRAVDSATTRMIQAETRYASQVV